MDKENRKVFMKWFFPRFPAILFRRYRDSSEVTPFSMQRAFDLVTRFPSPLLIIRQPIVSSWESLMDPIQCRSGLYILLTDFLLPVSLVCAKKCRWGSDRQLPRFCPPLFVSYHPLPFDALLYTYLISSNLMFLWPCIMNWPYKTTNVMHWILFIQFSL